jgi:Zn-dependent peptidase ImmA (M78 family)
MKTAKLYDGKSINDWAKHYNVSRQRIYQRLKNTGSVHGTVGPLGVKRRKRKDFIAWNTIFFEGKSFRDWMSTYKVPYHRVEYAYKKSQKRNNPAIFHNLLKA